MVRGLDTPTPRSAVPCAAMKRVLAIVAALALALPLVAQKKQLTLDAIYKPSARVAFGGAVQSGFEWIDDAAFVWPKTDEKSELVEWERFDATTGKVQPLFAAAQLEQALREAGVAAAGAKQAAHRKRQTFDAKKDAIVLEAADDLFLYSVAKGTARRLTSTPAREEIPGFSPDGRRIAFVRDNNLFVLDLASGGERQLTTDGSAQVLNGRLDWVYEEEIYGRGREAGYWWSPDSQRIAFLQLTESGVPSAPIVDHVPLHQVLTTYTYPQAGDPNPHVKLKIAPAGGGALTTVDDERYSAEDFLVVNVAWKPDSNEVVYQVQNREQTWLDLDLAAADKGDSRPILRETTPAWVNENGAPLWLADGTFLWISERSGYRHIYHYKADGTLIRQVTDGKWEVRDLHGIDGKSGFVYFSGTERSPIGLDVYRVKLDGSGLQRLSGRQGTHEAKFSPSCTWYVDDWSDVGTPDQARLHGADGTLEKVVSANPVPLLAQYDLPRPEFTQATTRDGFVMEAMVLKPSNFDQAKKYPVFQYLYAGPHAQEVLDKWRGNTMLFLQLLANQGVVVWMCDNRTASGKGIVSTWPLYKHFGVVELRDIEDGLASLEREPWIDASRVMLYGWSFGGFMTSYALTHSTSFVAGVAGGTVADWRDYDSVYTERYMTMPQHNADGYRASSPRWSASSLHGNLLLIHGTVDDNVHLQNTIQFVDELEKAGKPFEMKLYPRSQHGVRDSVLVQDLQRTILDFAKRNLLR